MNLSKEEANRRLEEALNRIDELEQELNDKDFEIEELQDENDSLETEIEDLQASNKTDSDVIDNLIKQMRKDNIKYLAEFEEYIENYFRFYVKEK